MWARLSWVWLVFSAAAALAGCSASKMRFPVMGRVPATQPAARLPARAARPDLRPGTGVPPQAVSGEDLAAFDRARALVTELQYAEAAKLLAGLALRFNTARDMPREAEATFWVAYCREKQGSRNEAARLYRRVRDEFSGRAVADEAARRLAELSGPATRPAPPKAPKADKDQPDRR